MHDVSSCPAATHNSQGAHLKIDKVHVASGIELVPTRTAHAAQLAALAQGNTDHLQRYLPQVNGLASVEAAEEHLAYASEAALEGELLEWHIFEGERLCGAVLINHIEQGNHKGAIAYYLGAEHQGKGLATSSVHAALGYCFEKLGFNRIELKCASTNAGSAQVARRLGFSREGRLRQAEYLNGEYVDHILYALLRQDFRPLKAILAPISEVAANKSGAT